MLGGAAAMLNQYIALAGPHFIHTPPALASIVALAFPYKREFAALACPGFHAMI
jgi:hypothetical protein